MFLVCMSCSNQSLSGCLTVFHLNKTVHDLWLAWGRPVIVACVGVFIRIHQSVGEGHKQPGGCFFCTEEGVSVGLKLRVSRVSSIDANRSRSLRQDRLSSKFVEGSEASESLSVAIIRGRHPQPANINFISNCLSLLLLSSRRDVTMCSSVSYFE